MEDMTALIFDGIKDGGTDSPAGKCAETKGRFPDDTPIGMAYVPFQFWERPYDDPTALARGTLFPSLDKPFIGEEAVKHGK